MSAEVLERLFIAAAISSLAVAAYLLLSSGRPAGDWTEILSWLGTVGFVALGAWAALTLGWRRLLAWRPQGDGPVSEGPYALVRHPLYLAAIGVTLLATRPFDALPRPIIILGQQFQFGEHWLPYTLALWAVAWLEERGLWAHYGTRYEAYARRVPRLWPN